MEHMRQFDWCITDVDSENFLEAEDFANSCTEKILQNRFFDPLLSADEDDDDSHRPVVDWDDVFAQSDLDGEGATKDKYMFYVPGDRPLPPFPKLSSLTSSQHFQMMKVLCARNPTILESLFFPKPTKQDYKTYEELKDKYEREQQDYIRWAATLWSSGHNIRALRPIGQVESTYSAWCRVRLHAAQCWPTHFHVAAQAPLNSPTIDTTCRIEPLEELVKVNLKELPHIQTPDYARRLSLLRPCVLPKPCNKHPSRFILPGEKSVSSLPLDEVHRRLCELAASHSASVIASETSLRTLVERDRSWTLPFSLWEVVGEQGEKIKVVALDNEISSHKESSIIRAHKGFKHLLLQSLIPPEEKVRMLNYWNKLEAPEQKPPVATSPEISDDEDDEDNLVIDMDSTELDKTDGSSKIEDGHSVNHDDAEIQNGDEEKQNGDVEKQNGYAEKQNGYAEKQNGYAEKQNGYAEKQNGYAEKQNGDAENQNGDTEKLNGDSEKQNGENMDENNASDNGDCDTIINLDVIQDESNLLKMVGDITCTCDDNALDRPAPRSYRLWDVQSPQKKEQLSLIVHSSHKARGKNGDVILEPILEYQPELGASEITPDRLRSIAVSLHLRKNAEVMLVRIDGVTGEVLCHSMISSVTQLPNHQTLLEESLDCLQVTLEQLRCLLPGPYLLKHEPSYGANSLIYADNRTNTGSFTLPRELQPLSEQDEALMLKQPRRLSDALLPIHKHRKNLPCAFTPFIGEVAREKRKPPTRQRTPPRALRLDVESTRPGSKWPKRRNNKMKRRRT